MGSDRFAVLREQVRGQVIEEGDADYDAARSVYNGMIDRRPVAVLRVSQVADVMAAIRFARGLGIEVAVRGGGHSAPGFGTVDGGLVLDFSARRGVRVDPVGRTARVEPGATWADFNHATHAFGLASTGGIIGSTGVSGLTLGGGIGYLARKYGLACDNLVAADVVLADGSFVTASEAENVDLFWALRGGSGNFGAVTSLEFRLHPLDMVHVGLIFFDAAMGAAVGAAYREWIASEPEEMGAFLGFHQGPPVPFLPEEWHGKPVAVIAGMWTGDLEAGPPHWQAMLDAGPALGSFFAPMPYPALNIMFDGLSGVPGLQGYWKADFLRNLSDEVLRTAVEYAPGIPTVHSANHFYPIDGAVQRVAPEATAFAYRDVKFAPVIAGQWPEPSENDRNIAWVRDYWAALHQYSEPGGYINFQDADDQSRIEDTLGSNYARLAELKAKYDPDNFFHVNQNITPAAPGPGPADAVPRPTQTRTQPPPETEGAKQETIPPGAATAQ
ncbi:FAD/FMN-dependent dehydrogenase [Pseudarthrobacter phenanthrenivorans Sphe3]|uniref:FAD/FMN-dependent dehydrogenase n=1 Tax=Pseudarthrobacter phenanthrenivorans (strain DSM 18606 / JCM 16027 / LMG 23796 / Sphe3) TaxID=930171 RepID=F0MB20_PSEPM|nr:FAD-binding oxidoreductase [Pseudarthrobacter phenanthrenivorans]ADX72896.1 FAD/FMN-dependent dehydrogenase [Pseudarthrobacter phenanthrenivorans Sphe3]